MSLFRFYYSANPVSHTPFNSVIIRSIKNTTRERCHESNKSHMQALEVYRSGFDGPWLSPNTARNFRMFFGRINKELDLCLIT